jgi:hypothetical protein
MFPSWHNLVGRRSATRTDNGPLAEATGPIAQLLNIHRIDPFGSTVLYTRSCHQSAQIRDQAGANSAKLL